MISSRLFKVSEITKSKAIQTTLLQSLLDYSSSPDEEDVPLEKVCSLSKDMNTQLSSKAVDALGPDWLDAAKAAAQRFQSAMITYGTSWVASAWESGGPDEVCDVLNACTHLPPELQAMLNLAKNSSILDDLKPVDAPSLTNLEKELPQLMRPVKKWMTILSLDMTLIEKFFSAEVVTHVKEFQASVIAAIEKVIDSAETSLGHMTPVVEKYRQGQFNHSSPNNARRITGSQSISMTHDLIAFWIYSMILLFVESMLVHAGAFVHFDVAVSNVSE